MNREIKFRAFNKESSHLFQPFYPLTNEAMGTGGRWEPNEDNFVFMQFTGLKDKNGKEIYEGDVVSVSEHQIDDEAEGTLYRVAWMGPEYPAFDLDGWDGESNALAEIEQSGEWDIVVIGNIYENPELVK